MELVGHPAWPLGESPSVRKPNSKNKVEIFDDLMDLILTSSLHTNTYALLLAFK